MHTSFPIRLWILFLLISHILFAQTSWQAIEDGKVHAENSDLLLPRHIRFDQENVFSPAQIINMISQRYRFDTLGYDFEYRDTETDHLGHHHLRYIQTYKGIPVEGSMYILHENDLGIYGATGRFYKVTANLPENTIPEAEALSRCIRHIGARTYQWELESEIDIRSDRTPKYPRRGYPKGEKVYVPTDGNYEQSPFRLAWKFDIYAYAPLSRTLTYIDASSGQLVLQLDALHSQDSIGTANTRFSGPRSITTQFTEGRFRLRQSGRGAGIFTWDMNDSTDFNRARDVWDQDNIWNTPNDSIDGAATDAHWGAEATYDFLLERFGRNSYDNEGGAINCYVHYGKDFNNAFWDGRRVVFGNGNGKSLATLDIVAHEIAHGLTQYTSNLIYQNESGALNESFSDIIGKAVEYYAKPETFTWKIGKDRGLIIRNMEDPNLNGHPKNYQGARWYSGKEDNGGVHINSGVQNYWFYLLVNGGQDFNDFGEAYEVKGIGMDSALAVVYRAYTVYMTPTSTYEDARYYTILSAIDLFGACTAVHESVINAWHAVGLDEPYSEVPVANFTASSNELCTAPYEVRFHQQASNTARYLWDFGDGTRDSTANPVHEYQTPGEYTVSLMVEGFCGNRDTVVQDSYIRINPGPPPPVTQTRYISCRDTLSLTAQGTGDIHWYDQWGEKIHVGDTLVPPRLNNDITYYAQNVIYDPPQFVGPVQDSVLGTGNYHDEAFDARIYFRVMRRLRLNSVSVDAAEAGERRLVLEDRSGNLIREIPVFIPAGKSRVELNLDLAPGSYRLGGSNMNLYRHRTGADFPYVLEDVISLDGSPPDAGPTFYYYLYDWSVSAYCASTTSETKVFVSPIDVPEVSDTTRCGPGQVTLEAGNNMTNVNWYDDAGILLHTGNRFTTPELDTLTTFFAESFMVNDTLKVGPEDESFGGGGFHNTDFDARLEFEVHKPIRLSSVYVHAGSAGNRRIVLEDGQGNMLDAFHIYIPEGRNRIMLNLDLQPGRYTMGGKFMDLFRNSSGAMYPYSVADLVSITGSNAFTSDNYYYYFYDWEVIETPCYSTPVPVQVVVEEQLQAAFSYRINKDTVSFSSLTEKAHSWLWDFGDGQKDSVQSPVHVYGDTGTFVVTFRVRKENCTGSIELPVVITEKGQPTGIISSLSKNLETLVKIAPNPASSYTFLELKNPLRQQGVVYITDIQGRKLHESHLETNQQNRSQIDLSRYPSGTYIVHVKTERYHIHQKLLVIP